MDKRDFKTADRVFYTGKIGVWARVTVPAMTYLMIDGTGDPDGPVYAAAVGALYPVAYGIKFAMKALGQDFVVPPLEALWFADDPSVFVTGQRDQWAWRAMIRVPDGVAPDLLSAAMDRASAKADAGALSGLRMGVHTDGDAFQTLHVGPYSAEGPILADLHDRVMPAAGVTFGQPHHEIYLSDPRRVAPEKLKTLIRQPVVPA